MTQDERLKAWLDAGLPGDDKSLDELGITEDDILELQHRVMNAVAGNIYATRPGAVFADHETLQ